MPGKGVRFTPGLANNWSFCPAPVNSLYSHDNTIQCKQGHLRTGRQSTL